LKSSVEVVVSNPMGLKLQIRPWADSDSIQALTGLINRAYATLRSFGIENEGATQSVQRTGERIARGGCLVALHDETLVGTLAFRVGFENSVCSYLAKPNILCLHQQAVEPRLQGCGIGHALMEAAEQWARELGFDEIVEFTAECHPSKRTYWRRNGIVEVDRIQWPGDAYFSIVGAKQLTP